MLGIFCIQIASEPLHIKDYMVPLSYSTVGSTGDMERRRDDALLLEEWGPELDAMESFMSGILESPRGSGNFTAYPAGERFWDFDREEDRQEAFEAHSRDGHPVYFYSTINGDGTVSLRLKVGYARLLEAGKRPYVGRWTDRHGRVFVDSVEAVDDGIGDTEVGLVLRRHDQAYATKLTGVWDEKGNISGVTIDYIGG